MSRGGGLANGFGGPVAPAERSADADGEGGGRTTPDECFELELPLAGVAPECRGDEASSAALSASEASLGICTFSLGLGPPVFELLVPEREGGTISGILVEFCCGCGIWLGGLDPLALVAISGGAILYGFTSSRESVKPKCAANTDPRSSIGVKMLRDFDDNARGRCGLSSWVLIWGGLCSGSGVR